MNKFIVIVDDPSVKDRVLAKHGKPGKPRAMPDIVIFETDLSLDQVAALPGVIMVEPDGTDAPASLDPNYQWQKNPSNWFLPAISNSAPHYKYNKTGKDVAIYIMDSGIRFTHQEFLGRTTKTVYSHDNRDYGSNVAAPDHGTMCASFAAGNQHGVAKEATIYNVRYDWSNIEGIKALDSVFFHYLNDNSVTNSILSMSFVSGNQVYTYALNKLSDAGMHMVAAAGNSNRYMPRWPSQRDDVISVGATDQQMKFSDWSGNGLSASNRGADINAPGSHGTCATTESDFSITTNANGTSFAAPLVAGALALRLEGSPKTNTRIEKLANQWGLVNDSRKNVIIFDEGKTDGYYKYANNIFLYTLGYENPNGGTSEPEPIPEPTPDPIVNPEPLPEPMPEPEPLPEPTPDRENNGNRLIPMVAVALVIAVLIFLAI